MLFFLALSCLAVAAFFAAEAVTVPSRERRESVGRAATYGRVRRTSRGQRENFKQRALTPLKESLAGWVLKLTPKLSADSVATKLIAAGASRRLSPTGFLSLKGGLAIGGLLFGLLVSGLLGAILVAAVGFFAPDIWLTFKVRRRREAARVQLPDALDLRAVSVEAGLGFDAAINKLMEHMEGPVSEEFALTLGEMRIGQTRQDALKSMSDRMDVPEFSAFTRAIIQADQLGISLGRILRVQAADTRVRRQQAAEERAMKAPVKMLFPTGVFIFPAMFVVILGPVALSLGDVF